jgi:hypothetical protein
MVRPWRLRTHSFIRPVAPRSTARRSAALRQIGPSLRKLLKRLDEGDVLVVTRLDRLARSARDLFNILDTVAKAGAGFRSLADAWADTTTPHGRLMLTVLGGLAEFEREWIRARTGEGRKRARARLRNGETQAEIARTYGVDATTIGPWIVRRPNRQLNSREPVSLLAGSALFG